MSDPHRQQDRIEYDEPNLPSLNQHEFEDSSSEFSENRKAPLKRGITSASRILSVITKKDIRTAYLAWVFITSKGGAQLITENSLTLLALGMAFAQYTETTFTAYATSAFKSHSELAAAGVVARVFSMVTYLIVSREIPQVEADLPASQSL